jgi:prophage maintenance system killer protein
VARKKTIHHMDFETLAEVNKGVVALTKEPHGFSPADRRKLVELVKEVEQRADNQDFEEAVADKASLLIYEIARGQFFRAGNKRTALVAGLAFLSKNGQALDIQNPEFVGAVDKAGVAAADLDDLYAVVTRLTSKAKTERKAWDRIVREVIVKNKDFLAGLAS